MTYFFVMGCPRSGTTVLQQALNRHSRIAIPPETAFAALLGKSRKAQAEHLRRVNADLQITLPPLARRMRAADAAACYRRMAELYLERLQKPGVTHFGEKSPSHQRFFGRLTRLCPGAKMVLIYRDGRDVAASLKNLPWIPADVELGFALWLHYYRHQRRLAKRQSEDLHLVQYEEFVAEPERVLRRVTAFLGLDYERALADGFGNREGVPEWEYDWKAFALEKVTASRVGLWKQALSASEIACLERWGARALTSLGYELSTDGAAPLPWMFLPKVYLRALRWVLTRPSFGEMKDICRDKKSSPLSF
ncbi:MAG TPA: sulfotransferase [Pirellulales bacterium]